MAAVFDQPQPGSNREPLGWCVCVCVWDGAIIEGSPCVAVHASASASATAPKGLHGCLTGAMRVSTGCQEPLLGGHFLGVPEGCYHPYPLWLCVCVCSVRPLVPPDVHHQEPCLRRIMISADPTWRRAGYGCPLRRSQWQLYSTNPNRDRTENLWVARAMR